MLQRSLLATFVALIAGALAPSIPVAAGPDPAAFINNLGHQLQVVARNTSAAERQAGFRELFDEDFDVPSLGHFVLGRLSQIMTAQEQQEFLGLFENYVVVTYSDRLSEYVADGAVSRVIGSRLDPDGAIVSSEFNRRSWQSTEGAIRVDWRLTRHDGLYKVSDIIIDGLSMAVNGRTELEGVAARNGWQPRAILAVMRQETASALLR
jgi:phospholipid transport system substrate-binding protein